ncbi:MAG: BolA family transcriptional regulator [Alphaproteobacteria bacterium]|nr:BolA family transcriptional regulator [Alphaproteobacteria bacterium]
MPMSQNEIETLIKSAFPDAELIITDLAGDNDHWSVDVKSSAFAGKSKVQQHQMVYAALKGNMGTTLHAMQLQTRPK